MKNSNNVTIGHYILGKFSSLIAHSSKGSCTCQIKFVKTEVSGPLFTTSKIHIFALAKIDQIRIIQCKKALVRTSASEVEICSIAILASKASSKF